MDVKGIYRYVRGCAIAALAVCSLAASEHHGVVKFGNVPVPGATITATQGDKKVVAVSDQNGAYSLPDLTDGVWKVQVEKLAFESMSKDIGVAPEAPGAEWSLKMLSLDQIKADTVKAPAPSPTPTTSAATPPAATGNAAADKPSIVAANAAANAAAANNGKTTAKGKTPAKPGTTAAAAQPGFQRAAVNATSDAPPPDSGGGGGGDIASADASNSASNSLVVNGSSSNGIERRAIGNFRRGPGSLYNGNASLRISNSALNAQSFSVSGLEAAKPSVNNMTGSINFGGPLIIPHVLRANGNFFLGYTMTRNRQANSQSALFPTDLERQGDFSQTVKQDQNGNTVPITLYDPTTCDSTGANCHAIPGNKFTVTNAQALALLKLFPKAQFNNPGAAYNYQESLVSRTDSDGINANLNKTLNSKNFLNFRGGFQTQRGIQPTIYNFVDSSGGTGFQINAQYRHVFSRTFTGSLTYTFSRQVTHALPYFAALGQNISGIAGITGNDQTPNNYGPPSLSFPGGITTLSDGNQNNRRNQTQAIGFTGSWFRRPHNFVIGVDYRPGENNPVGQQNPRGSFTFTGGATGNLAIDPITKQLQPVAGNAFADFLLGRPGNSDIAFGNADKYFRYASYDAYINDDWRINSVLTLNYGVRWEYSSPITEKYGRLVNLDVAPGFGPVAVVTGQSTTGALTHYQYPLSMIQPDKHAIGPKVSFAWHPFFGASTIFRGGYALTYDTSVYQNIADRMAQQAPFSKNLSIATSTSNPLTLANGFTAPANILTNNFAIDPGFRLGYAQNWQLSVQQNLTGSMVATVTYNGIKGTRAQQAFAPNTYPDGINPCAICATGYTYLTSNGNSTRHSGQVNIRRRFHMGFQTQFQYTYSKALDDAQLGGGNFLAQDWQHLNHERGLSAFDQRHNFNVQFQYTTGTGIRGGALLGGWRGTIFKGWTISSNINAGSGRPLSPVLFYSKQIGVLSSGRPDYSGKPIYDATGGRFLNNAAFSVPANGQWGNAGRNSITGPNQFNMTATMSRSFDRFDLTFDAQNPINHVTVNGWNTTFGPQFGAISSAANMRTITATFRVRFL